MGSVSTTAVKSYVRNSILINFQSGLSIEYGPPKILVGTPTVKRPLGRPRRRWEDNIKTDLKEMGINTRNWVDSAQNRDYWGVFC